MTRVLVRGGTEALARQVAAAVAALGWEPSTDRPDVVVVLHGGGPAASALTETRRREGSTPIIFVAPVGSEQLAVDAFRAGADDYLTAPVTPASLAESLGRLRPRRPTQNDTPELLGTSGAMARLREVIRRIAPTPCSVLITGETGTGKDVVAGLIHRLSERASRPFVGINCTALPETLFESELFGYERGAFTGAQGASVGRLQAAHRGTVFLDEIGELGLSAQPKLLRVIEQREVQRLGSRRHETIDVRWIAATNRDLRESVRDGTFRADLYYRLNVYNLVIPPLRERPEDVVALAQAFLAEFAATYRRTGLAFADDALARLLAYPWPGNVRELRNLVESAVAGSDGPTLDASALPPPVRAVSMATPSPAAVERMRVVEAMRAAGGNKSEAAQRLNWSRMTLYRKIQRHRIDVTTECDTVTAKARHA